MPIPTCLTKDVCLQIALRIQQFNGLIFDKVFCCKRSQSLVALQPSFLLQVFYRFHFVVVPIMIYFLSTLELHLRSNRYPRLSAMFYF